MNRTHLFALALAVSVPALAAACSPAGPSQAEGPKPDLDKPPKGAGSGEPIAPELADAQAALEAKNCAVAKEKAGAVLAKDPKHGDAHFIMGACAEADKNDAEAIKHYQAALEANPKNSGAAINLSAIYIDKKQHDEAIEVCKKGLEATKGASVELHTNLGWAFAGKGDHEKAAKSFGNAAKLKPEDGSLRLALADEHLAAGQKDAAAKAYKEAIAKAKGDQELVRAAGLGLFQTGDFAGCVAALDTVITAKPGVDVYTERAACKHKAGDLAGARADLDASIKLKPTVKAHGYAAKWAEEAKDKKACSAHWSEVGKLAAGTKVEEEAKKGLERCKKL